jgi:predicted PurR-regulated permease PerM
MAPTSSTSKSYRPLVVLGSVVLVTASLYLAQKILIPLALAVLLAFILSPVVDTLQRRGLWRVPSVLLVVALSLLLVSGVGLALALQLKNLAAGLPKYKDNIALKITGLREAGHGTVLGGLHDMIKELTEPDSKEESAKEGAPHEVRLLPEQSSGVATLERLAGPVGELLASTGLVVVLVIFMLIRREDLRNRLVRLVAHGRLSW